MIRIMIARRQLDKGQLVTSADVAPLNRTQSKALLDWWRKAWPEVARAARWPRNAHHPGRMIHCFALNRDWDCCIMCNDEMRMAWQALQHMGHLPLIGWKP